MYGHHYKNYLVTCRIPEYAPHPKQTRGGVDYALVSRADVGGRERYLPPTSARETNYALAFQLFSFFVTSNHSEVYKGWRY